MTLLLLLQVKNMLFRGHFDHFQSFLPHRDFPRKTWLSHKSLFGSLIPCKVSEKTNDPYPRKLPEGQKENERTQKWILIHGRCQVQYLIRPFSLTFPSSMCHDKKKSFSFICISFLTLPIDIQICLRSQTILKKLKTLKITFC